MVDLCPVWAECYSRLIAMNIYLEFTMMREVRLREAK